MTDEQTIDLDAAKAAYKKSLFQCTPTDLTKHAGKTKPVQVTYAISYNYNGGIVVDDKWYAGYDVPPPIVPAGFELKGMGVGADFNSRPPRATALLIPKTNRKEIK